MKFIYLLILLNQINYSYQHTWIDKLECDCTGGIGYPRGYLGREFISDFDNYNTYQIQGRDPDALISSPHQRHNFNYPDYPKLKCAPGSKVSFWYNPNGHIAKDPYILHDPRGSRISDDPCLSTNPQECPTNLGPMTYWYIASNKDISPNELTYRKQVNTNQGLDLDETYHNNLHNIFSYKNSYDIDGTCKEDGEPCMGEFTLPTDLNNHTDYQLVFYWVFDRDFRGVGEEYTSTFTIHIHDYPECRTTSPTNAPTNSPTNAPTTSPTTSPTNAPTNSPTPGPHC